MSLLEEIKRSHELADASMERMKACASAGDRDGFYRAMHDFICLRFFIAGLADGEDNLDRLAEMSLKRIFELTGGSGLGGDVSLKCTGSSSVKEKIILVELLLKKQLGASLDPFKAAYIETVSELADALYHGLPGGDAMSDRE